MSLFYLPRQFVVDGTGAPRSGAKLNFYQAGTLTRQDTYADVDLTTPNTNPVVANAAGVFGPIYLANASYRVIMTDADDVTIYDQDDVNAQTSSAIGSGVLVKSSSYTISASADNGAIIEFTAASTVTLPTLEDAGDPFSVAIFNTSDGGDVTIDPAGSETVNGESSLTIGPRSSAIIAAETNEWKAITLTGEARGSFTATLSGMAASTTGTIFWRRQGRQVTLLVGSGGITGTSNADTMRISGLPQTIQPTTRQSDLCSYVDNSQIVVGLALVYDTGDVTAGSIDAFVSYDANADQRARFVTSQFTDSNNKGLSEEWSISYWID